MNNIVNIVNFIRAIEPRVGRGELDLFEPVREQMAMAKRLKLPTTWLLQYDALIQGPFVEFLKREMPENHEVGIWFETVQPNVEAAGIKWRGRWAWDWHTDVGFSVGYTPQERERIADVFVAKFAEIFGRKPAVMGSWLFDAHLLEYLWREHGLRTACNCKDQYGTDGYTLWGGYWANAYYPSRKNSYLPAQHESGQIPVPVFRMLGSDPLYQYTAGVGGNGQSVITLEPVYEGIGGGSKPWIDWFLRENFREPHFAMAYAQAGQENSFGWPKMRPGLPYQYERLARLRDEGAIRVETLGESGEWFRQNFRVTPVSASGHAGGLEKGGSRRSLVSLPVRAAQSIPHGKTGVDDSGLAALRRELRGAVPEQRLPHPGLHLRRAAGDGRDAVASGGDRAAGRPRRIRRDRTAR